MSLRHQGKEGFVGRLSELFRELPASRMSGAGGGSSGGGGGVGGALSLMGCVREASPPPQVSPHLGDAPSQSNMEMPKEPKRRRFHPLRGLRKIFRRKSRGAADAGHGSGSRETCEVLSPCDREEVTVRHPAGGPEDVRSRSASELLRDSCDRERQPIGWPRKYKVATSLNTHKSFKHVFIRRSGVEESFAKLRGGAGQLSVSHDSVFPGEVPHTRPLSSLDPLVTLERRQGKTTEAERKELSSQVAQRHRISLRVLEQIKTVIENRNQVTSTATENHISHNKEESYQQEATENILHRLGKNERSFKESQIKITQGAQVQQVQQVAEPLQPTRPSKDGPERTVSPVKEDLPRLESASLNHTAALHRISVRPKNRRPPRPRRTISLDVATPSNDAATSTEEASDNLDSLEPAGSSNTGSPVESKNVSILRKSSSRLSRSSDIFEELEGKLPRKAPSAVSLSPDSLDASVASKTSERSEHEERPAETSRPVTRRASNRVSQGPDILEELEAKLPRRHSSSKSLSKSPDSLESSWFSKSSEAFEKLEEDTEDLSKPVALVKLRQSIPYSKSIDRVSKSSDSLEMIDALSNDDSVERRRSGFEFRARRQAKVMSKSSESFEALEKIERESPVSELEKRSSASDLNLSRPRRHSSKISFASSGDLEKPEETVGVRPESVRSSVDLLKSSRRPYKRTTASSESSDNLEIEQDDELENRRPRRMAKRISSGSIVDIRHAEKSPTETERRAAPLRKPSRLEKSSESSELGSTDTLDSEKRNKSSGSTETLDSLEKDLELDRREEEVTDSVLEKREKNEAWSLRTADAADIESSEDAKQPLISEKSYWRQSNDSKENMDIHQLLAITIVTRMADNGNHQRGSVMFPKRKLSSPPTSPEKQEDNKLLFHNLLASKNDEDLQNMLNGNISEVSTDTKSFKEKLIMFEKLGK
ncbi:neurofilament heavy polypeptide isoform X2 [Cephus cinctus]|uniref:Neurofilament heavy polypeptide isoform X2 n=1 Tax=Cephus cinctus TaxID=211228 RepID=A0AAJ7C8D6_CEPCN|nr:neurofilament heavy polypeptide isoform X2 [Cephus cinctus]